MRCQLPFFSLIDVLQRELILVYESLSKCRLNFSLVHHITGEEFGVNMEGVCFEKFDTAGTTPEEVKEPAHADEIQEDRRWDESNKVSKIKNWRNDTHTIHRNSNSAYSHYTQSGRSKIADAPRWPAQAALHTKRRPAHPPIRELDNAS